MKLPFLKIRGFLLVLGLAAAVAPRTSAQSGSVYVGNSLTVANGAADGLPPFVILGEYSPAGPLAAASASATAPFGTVKDVTFYGQNYHFNLYALSLVAGGPVANEQTFRVAASASFAGTAPAPRVQILPVSGFALNPGELLAFAGTGPYYSQASNDALHSDATYEDATSPGSFVAIPPAGPGSLFTAGLYGDSSAAYSYISDAHHNQGRNYAIGVDVTLVTPLRITLGTNATLRLQMTGSAGQTYLLQTAPSLAPPVNWQNIFTNPADPSGNWTFTNTIPPPQLTRFYRAVAP